MSMNRELLQKLAAALVANPRGTTKDLAEAAGISKATLHRFCGTRENLEKMLFEKSSEAIEDIIEVAQKDFKDHKEGLHDLINIHYEYREYFKFMYYFPDMGREYNWDKYSDAIDSFYLNGQKKGVFKIELSDAFFSEVLISMLYGLFDAVDRGRIAPKSLIENIKTFVLHGCANN
ncbi:TetR/AcrR family transcriptional regulator [Hominibacterium faecale]|uniref:TetR/AcrR family transcriptional regulator n=1 Tax=Hominibacterium faecale TaxID=2839743 RepID=UPI0022B2A537|nr:transcriptional regulator NfxB [Hominibacterium faecale]